MFKVEQCYSFPKQEVDLEMLDSAGSLSASSQSLNTPLYRSSSSLSSSGPSGTAGARPKNEVSKPKPTIGIVVEQMTKSNTDNLMIQGLQFSVT